MGKEEITNINTELDCEIETLPFIDCTRESVQFVYLLLKYGFGVYGTAVVIWTEDRDHRFTRYTYATGPIQTDLDEEMEWLRRRGYQIGSYDDMLNVFENNLQLLKECREERYQRCEPVINVSDSISRTEFDRAMGLAAEFGDGSLPVLGESYNFRVVARSPQTSRQGSTGHGKRDVTAVAVELSQIGGLGPVM